MENNEEYVGKSCRNCNAFMAEQDKFCPECSQKYTDGRVTLRELMHEFFEAILNIDSKLFKTLGTLPIPGRLTNEYFAGKHKSYLHPLRLFFVSAILFFFMISFLVFRYAEQDISDASDQILKEDAYRTIFVEEFQEKEEAVRDSFNQNPLVNTALDSLNKYLKTNKLDSIQTGIFGFKPEGIGFETETVKLSSRDAMELGIDSLAQKYNITGSLKKFMLQQELRMMMDLKGFVSFIIGQSVWAYVIMMPLLALFLKLLYIRRKRFFVEHLIFTFHYHAFLFLATTTILLIGLLTGAFFEENPNYFIWPAFFIGWIYLFISMKRVYKQNWFKTLVKFGVFNITYFFILNLSLGLTILLSLFLF